MFAKPEDFCDPHQTRRGSYNAIKITFIPSAYHSKWNQNETQNRQLSLPNMMGIYCKTNTDNINDLLEQQHLRVDSKPEGQRKKQE